jgi:nitrite reductase/ring-hydroxylating ferredoxin subunit
MTDGGPRRIAAGGVEIGPGQVRVLCLPPDADGTPREALLLRDGRGRMRAYLNRCQHLPVTLDAGGRRFMAADGAHLECQTHGARYRIEDGYCVQGPCVGRVLEAFAIEIDGGRVYLRLEP